MSTPQAGEGGFHIAALYETVAGAHAARDALTAAGVPASSILVLDRGHAAIPAESPKGLWAHLKHMLVPDAHAHIYAEGVARGHPMVIADVTDTDTDAATAALKSANPINIDKRAQVWTEQGWDGVNGGQGYWLNAQAERDAAGSEGITAGGIMAGDYGAVGAPRFSRADTNILRGMPPSSGAPPDAAPQDGIPVNDDPQVRVYKVGE
jgi:hypothetical protein